MARKHGHEVARGNGYIEERPTKGGNVRYQARWREGRSWRSKTFGTVDDAEDHLRRVGRAKRSGLYTPESRLTVDECLSSYMDRGKQRWKANTWNTYGGVIKFHIRPYIGTIRMVELTPWRVQQWIDDLMRSGLSASVIENARVILNGACKESMRMGVLTSNPVAGASLPPRTKRKYSIWTSAQARAVLAACHNDARMWTYYTVALTTAMRPGEIRALQWSDIDFEKGRLHVQRTITRDERGRQVIGTTTKTDRSRMIALPPSTVKALRSWRASQSERRLASHKWYALDLVFDRGDGMVLPQNTVARAHKRIAGEAGVPIIRLHDVRHTAATLLLEAGTHVKIVSDLLGHSQIATTLDIYSHPDESMVRGATQALADALERDA